MPTWLSLTMLWSGEQHSSYIVTRSALTFVCHYLSVWSRVRSCGQVSGTPDIEAFAWFWHPRWIALFPIIDSFLPNNTLKLATEQATLDFYLRQDKIRADLLQTSRKTGRDSLSSDSRLLCVPGGKHKTWRTALCHKLQTLQWTYLLSHICSFNRN